MTYTYLYARKMVNRILENATPHILQALENEMKHLGADGTDWQLEPSSKHTDRAERALKDSRL